MEQSVRRTRRRPALSCLECRRRKIRCDRHQPCEHCVATKARCVFKVFPESAASNTPKRSETALSEWTPGRSLVSPSSDAVHRTESLSDITSDDVVEADPASDLQLVEPADVQTNSSGVNAILNRVKRLESRLPASSTLISTHGHTSEGENSFGASENRPPSRVHLNKTRTLRWSHFLGMTEEVCH